MAALALAGTAQAQRPQLSAAQAAAYGIEQVLAAAGPVGNLQHDGWRPLQDPALLSTAPGALHYKVDPAAADGLTVFSTVQAAVNQAHLDLLAGRQNAARVLIGIVPGRYAETVVVPASPRPITLWGLGERAEQVLIERAVPAGLSGAAYRALLGPAFDAPGLHEHIRAAQRQCAARPSIGTSCSAVLQTRNTGFHLRQLSVQNSHDPRPPGTAAQAVALLSDGADQVVLDHVRLLSLQDTLYLKTSAPEQVARVLVQHSLVQGDVDFIFGRATAYFLRSEIRSLGGARPQAAGYVTAASTHQAAPYGLVFEDCDFTSDGLGAAARGEIWLGRQWFEGAACSPFGDAAADCKLADAGAPADAAPRISRHSLQAVGKVVVLRSRLGMHLRQATPWSPWQAEPGHRAHRPVLYNSDVHWQLLQRAGLAQAVLGNSVGSSVGNSVGGSVGDSAPVPAQPYLAEYLNQPAGPALLQAR